jgi:ribosomal protein L7/L12
MRFGPFFRVPGFPMATSELRIAELEARVAQLESALAASATSSAAVAAAAARPRVVAMSDKVEADNPYRCRAGAIAVDRGDGWEAEAFG